MRLAVLALMLMSAPGVAFAATAEDAQARIARDVAAGRPIVVHVVVALCDNVHQGIVPVPKHLGNGQDPRSNLYWGAMFGARTFFARSPGWTSVPMDPHSDKRILDRALFIGQVARTGVGPVPVYVVADAWDGAEIRSAIDRFLTAASGGARETVSFRRGARADAIAAGGSAHVVAFVGHNGLMEFSLRGPQSRTDGAINSSIVLACASKPYFLDLLRAGGSHPLLLTTGLMAPEAYTLDAAIRSWVAGHSVRATRDAAAAAYHRHQKCGLTAARRLFWGESADADDAPRTPPDRRSRR